MTWRDWTFSGARPRQPREVRKIGRGRIAKGVAVPILRHNDRGFSMIIPTWTAPQTACHRTRRLSEIENSTSASVRSRRERELRSRWLNPTTLGLFAAALALVGNIVNATYNNRASREVERTRSQSSLILEAIKTGNVGEACKNLTFFVQLGLLDDPTGSIRRCVETPSSAPVLPAAQPKWDAQGLGYRG